MAQFNPLDHVTIASACNRDLRQNRLEENTIASEPLYGWRRKPRNQSGIAMEWLYWLQSTTRPQLQHARNRGEFQVPGTSYLVDGYDPTTRTIYEFYSCWWHGCPRCYQNRTEPHRRLLDRTLEDAWRKTEERRRTIQRQGFQVATIWECAWVKMKADNAEIQAYVDSLDLTEPLEPRDAFYGGRTTPVKLYHRVDETKGEKIDYDFTSLYPFVNKNSKYLVGHPHIIAQPGHTDLTQYFGLAKCKVLPPYGLFHPVLPWRHRGKLLFPLCAACATSEMTESLLDRCWDCPHTDDQRCLIGTWCTPELVKATEMGYQIVYLYEVWHFPDSMEGLFKVYVDTWLKLKEEASGWPSGVTTAEQRQQYVDEYLEEEGVQLEADKIAKNPGRRALAKMMLNSMWGKFGQRPNKTRVREFDDVKAFCTFHESEKVEVQWVSVLTEERVEVHYKHEVEAEPVAPHLNVFVAAFTTCWARLRLYTALEMLGERVLYMDTDSVVFSTLPDQPKPPLGQYLGEFKSELDADDHIVEFMSAGPKNYGYQMVKGKGDCKVKGLSLTREGLAQVNYQVMRQNLLDEIQSPLEDGKTRVIPTTKTHQIVRHPKEYQLETVRQNKKYQLVFDKRAVDETTFTTYPYGYQAT